MSILKKFRTVAFVSASLTIFTAQAEEKVPKVFGDYLAPGENIKGELGVVLPPKDIEIYVAKVKEAAKKDPVWFKEFSTKSKPGIPLPFDDKLGLTQKEYQSYRALWDKREFKVMQMVGIRLESTNGKWKFKVSGAAARLSLLTYDPESDVVVSMNGDMARIEDVDAPAESILRAWKGHEWKFEEETGLGTVKENFAIGKTGDGKFGILVYRLQDITAAGTPLVDQSMVIRFAMKGAK